MLVVVVVVMFIIMVIPVEQEPVVQVAVEQVLLIYGLHQVVVQLILVEVEVVQLIQIYHQLAQ